MGDMEICKTCRFPAMNTCDMYRFLKSYGKHMPLDIQSCSDYKRLNPKCLRCGKESNGEKYGLCNSGEEGAMIELGHPKDYYLCDACSHNGSWYLLCLEYILKYHKERLARKDDDATE